MKNLIVGILLCLFMSSGLLQSYASEKIYVSNPEKAHQVNASIKSSSGDIENSTWFRIHQKEGSFIDVSSVHGDEIGVFFYPTDIRNQSPNCWGVEYHWFFQCEHCKKLQDTPPPPCSNPYCVSNRS